MKGVKSVILAMRDANACFSELTLNTSTLHDPKIMKLVAAMLDKNTSLVKLDLSNCGITDVGVCFLLKGFFCFFCFLLFLLFMLFFFNQGLVNHPRIRYLDMSGNKLGSSRASADLFVWASRTKSLEVFKMARTEMGQKSCKDVAALLEDPSSILKCIDISGNDYGSKGATLILGSLAKNAMLQEVFLGGLEVCNGIACFFLRFFYSGGRARFRKSQWSC